ncbi:hypothetical protein [Bacillus mesophilum]|uniref:Uncharacterized protein n=1 Tax=Bacillus mesophilum TaxID=1071718 RepID=A0A7V7RIJ3_9BACI|nr:hypothetical protein [Bacillus mesophilum]KAB2330071.1 hypothetical protein F7732_20015 [Bacillus mesophilum]
MKMEATGVLCVDTRSGEEYIQEEEVVVLLVFQMNNVKLMLKSGLGIQKQVRVLSVRTMLIKTTKGTLKGD